MSSRRGIIKKGAFFPQIPLREFPNFKGGKSPLFQNCKTYMVNVRPVHGRLRLSRRSKIIERSIV